MEVLMQIQQRKTGSSEWSFSPSYSTCPQINKAGFVVLKSFIKKQPCATLSSNMPNLNFVLLLRKADDKASPWQAWQWSTRCSVRLAPVSRWLWCRLSRCGWRGGSKGSYAGPYAGLARLWLQRERPQEKKGVNGLWACRRLHSNCKRSFYKWLRLRRPK